MESVGAKKPRFTPGVIISESADQSIRRLQVGRVRKWLIVVLIVFRLSAIPTGAVSIVGERRAFPLHLSWRLRVFHKTSAGKGVEHGNVPQADGRAHHYYENWDDHSAD